MAAAAPWQEAGKQPGVQVWRIENFRPVFQSDHKQLGRFYTGDSYLILHTVATAGGLKTYNVHFWLGNRTTQDEAGAAAILATELDDALGGKAKQFRELQSHESEELMQLFGESLHYLQGGVASGFHHVTPEKHQPCLLHIKVEHPRQSKKGVRVTEVPMVAASLNSGDVFVADLDDRIIVWAGAACKPDEKSKALEVVEARRADRNGQAEVVRVAQGEKSADAAEFFLALGEQSSAVAIAPVAVTGADEAVATPAAAEPRLFRAVEGAAPEELEQRPLTRALLDPTAAYVLLAGSAVQIWQGSGASAQARGASLASAHELLPALGLPPSTPMSLVKQGFEDPAFTKHFEGWGSANGAVAPSPGAIGAAAATGPPTAAPGQRRSSGQEAAFGNGAAAAVNAPNGALRPASAGAKQLPARPAQQPPGTKPVPMQRGPREQDLAEAAAPAPPATPPPSASGGPKAGGGTNSAETPQRVVNGGPDRGVPAPATPAANGRPVSAPKSMPAKTTGVPVKDGDATMPGSAAPPGGAAETAAHNQVTGGAGESGGAATASGSKGSGVEAPSVSVRKLLDGFKAPLAERDARPLPRLRPSGAARGALSSAGSGDQPFTPKPFVPEVTKPPRVAENLKYVPGKDVLPYTELKKLRVEHGVDMLRREAYLSDAEFETVFGKSRGDFAKLPKWRQQMAKKSVGLF